MLNHHQQCMYQYELEVVAVELDNLDVLCVNVEEAAFVLLHEMKSMVVLLVNHQQRQNQYQLLVD